MQKSSPLPIASPSSIERISMFIESDRSIARKLENASARNQKETIKKISELLHHDRKEVIEGVCFHYAGKGKTKMAITYAEMYISEHDIPAENLANIFQEIMNTAYQTIGAGDFEAGKMPQGLEKLMKKADTLWKKDPEGIIALMQGRVSQLFKGDYEGAIEQYGKSYLQEHPAVYNPLGKALAGIWLMEDAIVVQHEWWEKYGDIYCLEDCIRLSFILKNSMTAVRYYQILKEIKPNAPHLVSFSSELNLSYQFDLVKDYFRGVHFQEFENVISKKSQDAITSWTMRHIDEINTKKTALEQLIEEKEKDGITSREELAGYEESLYYTSLELLDLLYFWAIWLLEDTLLELYMQNISRLLDSGMDGREFLIGHIEYTQPYAAFWMNDQISEEINDPHRKTPRNENDANGDFDTTDELMGILDMVLTHNYTYNDEDVMDWYEESARKIVINDSEMEEYESDIMALRSDILTERRMFLNMPDSLQTWYKTLREKIDEEDGIFFRKKLQCAHRSRIAIIVGFTSLNTVLFSIMDGFLGRMEKEVIFEQYMEKLKDFDMSHDEGLHLCNLCSHFGYPEAAFDLLCGEIVDWWDSETILLALSLVYDLSERNNETAKKLIEKLEKAIAGQGYKFKGFETFLESHINSPSKKDKKSEESWIIHEIAGRSLYLYGEREEYQNHLLISHEKGSGTALSHLSQIYSHEGEYEKAYETLKKIYTSDNPKMLFETGRMVELAIATKRRKEAKELLSAMEWRYIKGTESLRFYYLTTGTEKEKIEAIRLLGVYDQEDFKWIDETLLESAFSRMKTFLKRKNTPKDICLTCKRSDALFPVKDMDNAVVYWQELQENIREKQFSLLSEHLEPFTDQDTLIRVTRGDVDESKTELSNVQIGLATEALFFRTRFMKDADFTLLADVIAKTFDILPGCEALAENWYEEARKHTTNEHAFALGYDIGTFWRKPTLH